MKLKNKFLIRLKTELIKNLDNTKKNMPYHQIINMKSKKNIILSLKEHSKYPKSEELFQLLIQP